MNQANFPEAAWLTPDKYERIGTNGTRPLLLVGRLKVSGEPLVATQHTDNLATEQLGASILDELLKFSGMGIRLDYDPYPEELNRLESEYKDYP